MKLKRTIALLLSAVLLLGAGAPFASAASAETKYRPASADAAGTPPKESAAQTASAKIRFLFIRIPPIAHTKTPKIGVPGLSPRRPGRCPGNRRRTRPKAPKDFPQQEPP